MAPPPAAYIGDGDGAGPRDADAKRGKMLYTFEASGEGELSVPEGRDLVQLAPDDGTGWVKVRAGYKEGLVPASYVDFSIPTAAPPPPAAATRPSDPAAAAAAKKKGPAVAPRRGARKLRYVEALYDYAAQSDAEHSMAEGERFVLVRDDPGDGWAEVERAGVTGSVPASYVQAVV